MRVFSGEVLDLRGEKKSVVQKVGDGSIIKLFDRTPYPVKPTDVVCPHFLELKWANGCYFDCAWCYLNGTYRFHPDWKKGKPNIKDFGEIESHLQALLSNDGFLPEILNAGELCDSLLAEKKRGETPPFSEFITDVLRKHDPQGRHRVLFLTKSVFVKNLLRLSEKARKRIIASFTLNADTVARMWEKKAPNVKARIEAARKVWDTGYETRIRIDPIVPMANWEELYGDLIDEVFLGFTPDRITLGSLRGLTSTIANSSDRSWTEYLSERSNWGKKVDFRVRYEIYRFILNKLKKEYGYRHFALCKETMEMWQRLGLDYRQIKCNCVP